MPLTEKEIAQIREEAKRHCEGLNWLSIQDAKEAYIAGATAAVTAERERAKGFYDDVKIFMETIPIDNGNVFFNGFNECRLKIIETINQYNQ